MGNSLSAWLRGWHNFINVNYVLDRLNWAFLSSAIIQILYEINHKDEPWITPEMTKILKNLLKKDDIGWEYGSGFSTVWLAQRTKAVTSIEHDKNWADVVKKMIGSKGLKKKVDYRIVDGQSKKDYVGLIDSVTDGTLDYVFVDGLFREECILSSLNKIKRGGLLMVDNVDAMFPKNEISISARYGRGRKQEVTSDDVYKIIGKLKDWRKVWTSTGIQDTVVWIKP